MNFLRIPFLQNTSLKCMQKFASVLVTISNKFKNNYFQNNANILECYIKKRIISNLVITTASKQLRNKDERSTILYFRGSVRQNIQEWTK